MVPPVSFHHEILELKFHSPRVASSSDDRARFLSEAHAAALNHSTIRTIHGVDESELNSIK